MIQNKSSIIMNLNKDYEIDSNLNGNNNIPIFLFL